jgi:Serine proteases of the peptidase family S9A
MEFLWLEELNSAESLAWVQKENALSVEAMKTYSGFQQHLEEGVEIYSSKNQLGCREIHNNFVYKVDKSEKSPIGKWVRQPYEDFKRGSSDWELLIDFDEYSKEHGKMWSFGYALFSPNNKRAMIKISLEDGDRRWSREFDMTTKKFVEGGFELPLSKVDTAWFSDDALLVGGDIPENQNKHGYSCQIDMLTRDGQRKKIFRGGYDEQFLWAQDLYRGGQLLGRYFNWDKGEFYWLDQQCNVSRVHVPEYLTGCFCVGDDVVFKLLREFEGFKPGTVLAANLQDAIANQKPKLQVVWAPTDKKFSSDNYGRYRDGIFHLHRENVSGKLSYFKKVGEHYVESPQHLPEGLQPGAMFIDDTCDKAVIVAESFTQPTSMFEWNGKDSFELIKTLPHQFAGDFEVSQKWATSVDGTKVPYFLMHKKDLKLNGLNPTLLYGYGGFMSGMTPAYRAVNGKNWLEKGGVMVYANIRGGDEFGVEWSMSARKENKQRSYDDFISVAEHLIATKVTTPRHLGIMGRSNGGLLVGAVTMQRPELFSAVVCGVPLLDMLRYTLLPPGATWSDEFGDPADEKMRSVIEKYSPFQNIRADKKYPPIYFHTSKADDRVHPSHARRMAAKMKAMGHLCYLYEEPTGGHAGGDVKVKAFNDALTYSYLWKHLG